MPKRFLQFAALNGLLAVMLGAFGAHALKMSLDARGMTSVYQTGVYKDYARYFDRKTYQMEGETYHIR